MNTALSCAEPNALCPAINFPAAQHSIIASKYNTAFCVGTFYVSQTLDLFARRIYEAEYTVYLLACSVN